MKRKTKRKFQRNCNNKTTHDSKEHAWIAANKMWEKGMKHCRPYKCPVCKQWHIGHRHKFMKVLDLLDIISGERNDKN